MNSVRFILDTDLDLSFNNKDNTITLLPFRYKIIPNQKAFFLKTEWYQIDEYPQPGAVTLPKYLWVINPFDLLENPDLVKLDAVEVVVRLLIKNANEITG